jgi:hypothetical protein
MTRLVPVLAVAAVAAVPASAARPAAGEQPLDRHMNPAGWRIDFPAAWRLERSGHRCRYAVGQATVATFTMSRAVRGHRTRISCGFSVRPPLDAHGVFPRDGVALRVLCALGGPYAQPPPRPAFPLTLDQLEPQDPSVPTQGAPRPGTLQISHHGVRYWVSAWIGEQASADDTHALERALASLRFMRARPRPGGLRRCEPK